MQGGLEMATIDDIRWGAYVHVTDSEGNERGMAEWRNVYFGDGLAVIMTSQRKRPGKKFIRFYSLVPFSDELKYLTTDIGDVIEEDDSKLVLKTPASIHTFKWSERLDEEEKADLAFNVLAALKDGGLGYDEWMKWAEQLTAELGDFKIGNNDDNDNLQCIKKTLWFES